MSVPITAEAEDPEIRASLDREEKMKRAKRKRKKTVGETLYAKHMDSRGMEENGGYEGKK